jgi:hypothetical protein
MTTYLAYHVDDLNQDGNLPIAAGDDIDEVRSQGIRRILAMGWTRGNLCVSERDDLSADDLAATKAAIDGYFAEKFPALSA